MTVGYAPYYGATYSPATTPPPLVRVQAPPRVLAWPFRFSAGQAATVEQDSEADLSQQVALVLLTRRGERPLAPAFGLDDPTNRSVDAGEITAAVAAGVPGITVTDVQVRPESASTVKVDVNYARSSGDQS